MRTSLARILLLLAAVGVIGLSAWSLHFFRGYQPLAGLTAGPKGLDQIGMEVSDATATGRVAGRRRWRISARRITFSRDQRQVSVEGLHHGLLFDAQEKPLATLMAGAAVYQSVTPVFGTGSQGFLTVSGGLRARLLRPYGPTVSTASLSWDPVRSLVQSQGPVSAQFPPGGGAVGGARLLTDHVQWDARRDILQSPGHAQCVFAQGAGTATGENVSVDLHSGDLTLHRLHGTFRLSREVEQRMARKSTAPLLTLAGMALAAAPLAGAPAKPPHDVIYDADTSTWLNAPHTVQMSGHVTFKQDDAVLSTESAVVQLDDEQQAQSAESRAPVHLQDTQDDLTGQHGFVDFTKHLATLRDKITLVVKPGPRSLNAPNGTLRSRFKDPATMTCEMMTYNYRRKYGTVPGPLTVRQKDRVLTADSGTYDGRTQVVTLVGHVRGHDHDNQIDAPSALFGVREGDEFIRIDSHVHGIFKQKPDNEANGDDTAPPDNPNAYDAIKNGGPASAVSPVPATVPNEGAPVPPEPTAPPESVPSPSAPAPATGGKPSP